MSPVVKSKSKEKSSGKNQKISYKHALTNGGTFSSAYNLVLGTFHILDNCHFTSLVHNGHFRNIDDINDNFGSFATNTNCDLFSNNGSYSSESQEQKDKNGTRRSENPPA